MKKIFLVLLFVLEVVASDLYLLGNDNQRMGCLSCSKYHTDSIWNKYGTYGSKYNDESIWNKYGTYGSKYNSFSPWNKYEEGMKIIDLDGNYYGQFTINKYGNQSRIDFVKSILDAYSNNEWESLEQFRDWVIPQIQ